PWPYPDLVDSFPGKSSRHERCCGRLRSDAEFRETAKRPILPSCSRGSCGRNPIPSLAAAPTLACDLQCPCWCRTTQPTLLFRRATAPHETGTSDTIRHGGACGLLFHPAFQMQAVAARYHSRAEGLRDGTIRPIANLALDQGKPPRSRATAC